MLVGLWNTVSVWVLVSQRYMCTLKERRMHSDRSVALLSSQEGESFQEEIMNYKETAGISLLIKCFTEV